MSRADLLEGADGNVEFLLWARAHAPGGLTAESVADGALEEVGP